MLKYHDIIDKSQVIRQQMETKMAIKSRDLSEALQRAGRRLPRQIRAQVAVLAAAEKQAGHPRLARQVDAAAVRQAFGAVSAHLRSINAAEARWTRFLSVVTGIAFNIAVVVGLFVWWLWWRGYV